ncbi:MAG: HIT domain-containing protein [Kiritimatiellia bacterium]|nr:HIT domain-containing protein [Kiritimatiellia bacterium]
MIVGYNMKRIWAPWRMEYILNYRQAGCFLCDICQDDKDEQSLVLKRGKSSFLLLNKYPYNNGHLLIAPYRHIDSLESMAEPEMTEMMQMASSACKILRASMHPDGFNLGLNIGAAAGAGLKDHIHLHIVPRWEGDTNFMPVLGEVKIIPQPLDELWRKLRKEISRKGAKNAKDK